VGREVEGEVEVEEVGNARRARKRRRRRRRRRRRMISHYLRLFPFLDEKTPKKEK